MRSVECATLGGLRGVEYHPPNLRRREAITRSIGWCFASSNNPRVRSGISHAGVAHTLAVCLLELDEMARGKGSSASSADKITMPKFVDIKLSVEQRNDFISQKVSDSQLIADLSALCDEGYRIGCSWSGEQQSYVVSMTCRNTASVNSGLCMSSFAKDIRTAVRLSLYKHRVVADEHWLGEGRDSSEDFG